MRRILSLFCLSLALAPAARAQSTQPSPKRLGIYLGIDNNVSTVRSDAAYLAGGEVGVILAQQFIIGLGGYALASEEALVPALAGGADTLRLGYGGVRVGYVFTPAARFHPVIDLLVGGGEIRAEGSTPEREDEIIVAEPSVAMEANLGRYMRGALGLSYRLVSGSDLSGVSSASLSGVTGRVTFRFGRF
jgi:hypothetical protein